MTRSSALPAPPVTRSPERVVSAPRHHAGTLGVQIEVFVEPGNALGGPNDLPRTAYLGWLRDAYRRDPMVREDLRFLARVAAHGRNRIAILSRSPFHAETFAAAVRALATTLSPIRLEDQP